MTAEIERQVLREVCRLDLQQGFPPMIGDVHENLGCLSISAVLRAFHELHKSGALKVHLDPENPDELLDAANHLSGTALVFPEWCSWLEVTTARPSGAARLQFREEE